MNHTLKYGTTTLKLPLEQSRLLGVLDSSPGGSGRSQEEIVRCALANPIGSPRLGSMVKPGQRVCIVVSDITRAWQKPSLYLPLLLEELKAAGVAEEDITFLCATGTHRGHTPQEREAILGPGLAGRFRFVDHDCRDAGSMVYLGTTTRGTRVELNRLAVEADHVILTGAIVFHLLVGYGGGKKSVLPGIASYQTIMQNHAMSLAPEGGSNPEARSGKVLGNPIHEDMLEAVAFLNPGFLLNVVMGPEGGIAGAVAGHWAQAHEAGCRLVERADAVTITQKAQMVVASAGGYPKDINLYQTIKTLINACEAAEPGGALIVLSQCSEGFGHPEVQEILQCYDTMEQREAALRADYSIAKFVGYYAAEIASRHLLILVSELDPRLVQNAGMLVASTVEEALRLAYAAKGTGLTTYLMPHGANTLPRMAAE